MQQKIKQSEKKDAVQSKKPVLMFSVAVMLIVGVWGIVLPRVAELPTMQEKIHHLDQKGIDPAAFFYTDHPNAFKKTNAKHPHQQLAHSAS